MSEESNFDLFSELYSIGSGIKLSGLDYLSYSSYIVTTLQAVSKGLESRRLWNEYMTARTNLDFRPEPISDKTRIKFYANISGEKESEQLRYIHNMVSKNLIGETELKSEIVFILCICDISKRTNIFRRDEKIDLIDEQLRRIGVDFTDLDTTETQRFLNMYEHMFINGQHDSVEWEPMNRTASRQPETVASDFKSEFYRGSLRDNRHNAIMDEFEKRDVSDYFQRFIKDSEVEASALLERVVGVSLEDFKESISQNYNSYIIINQGLLQQNSDLRGKFMDSFDFAIGLGGNFQMKNSKEDFFFYGDSGEKLNFIIVSESNLSLNEVICRYNSVVGTSSNWDNEVATNIIRCSIGERVVPDSNYNRFNFAETNQIWDDITESTDWDKRVLTEQLEEYLTIEEILSVIPISFFHNECEKELETALFNNYYTISKELEITDLSDWNRKDITAERVYSVGSFDLEHTTKEESIDSINTMIENVQEYTEMWNQDI